VTKDFINTRLALKTTTTDGDDDDDRQMNIHWPPSSIDGRGPDAHPNSRSMYWDDNAPYKLDTHPRSQWIHLDENVSNTF